MWISQQIKNNHTEPSIQSGKSTLNSKGHLEAVSTGVGRSIEVFSPYGYSYSLPTGTDMLLADFDGKQGAIGTAMTESTLSVGEIKIASPSGAYVYFRKDGCVEINGLIISKTGEIIGNNNK